MSETTPESAPTPEPEEGRAEEAAPADGTADARATAPAASAAAESQPAPEPEPQDADAEVVNPPSGPVSARGHINRPAEEGGATGEVAPRAAEPAAPEAPVEPEPVVATEEDVAAAVARSTGEQAPGATAAGAATVDTATPAQSAEPVIVAAEAASLHAAGSTATAAYAQPAGTATWAPEPTAAPAPAAAPGPGYAQPVTPIFVQRPEPPRKRSNRGIGILIALVGTVAFALLWTGLALLVASLLAPGNDPLKELADFYAFGRYSGWVPSLAFFVGMVVLIQIVNRARWWAYILGGLFVAAFVYFAYIGAGLIDAHYWSRNPEEQRVLLGNAWVNPFAVLAGVIAREIAVWTGAWLAARGRRLKARNAEAQADYEQQLADAQNQAVAAYASGAGY